MHRDLEAPIMERKPVHSDILQPPPSSRQSRGCYGDGGAIFTDNDEWAALLRSMRVHGKGSSKYDNVRLGMNSRLDTIQAAVLQVKLKAFKEYELTDVNRVAARYTEALADCVKVPQIPDGYTSSWASYNILSRMRHRETKYVLICRRMESRP